MLKSSEIIRMAINHPSYLNEHIYLCHLIQDEFNLPCEQESVVIAAINSSIGDFQTLQSHLIMQGVYSCHQSQEYKQAAFEHWNKLIEKLEKEGK